MRLGLLVLGVGEFRSFQDNVQDSVYFIRFMQENGDTFELPVTSDQMEVVVARFAEQSAAQPAEDPYARSQPAQRPPAPLWVPPQGDDDPVVVFQAGEEL